MSKHDSDHTAHGSHDADHAAHEGHSHGGVGKYFAVFGALLVLTVISFGIANSALMETPQVGWALMMAVSAAKAMLVITFFMHLLWEANWKYVLTIPASIMSIFLVLALVPDVGMRTRHYSQDRWLHAATPRARVDHEDAEGAHRGEVPPAEHGETATEGPTSEAGH